MIWLHNSPSGFVARELPNDIAASCWLRSELFADGRGLVPLASSWCQYPRLMAAAIS